MSRGELEGQPRLPTPVDWRGFDPESIGDRGEVPCLVWRNFGAQREERLKKRAVARDTGDMGRRADWEVATGQMSLVVPEQDDVMMWKIYSCRVILTGCYR